MTKLTEDNIQALVNIDTKPVSNSKKVYMELAALDEMAASDIIYYGENNLWQISTLSDFKPTSFRKLVLNDVLSEYEELANDPDQNYDTAIIKYTAIHPIAFWHSPALQYFYYRCARWSPGIIRTMWFVTSSIVSIIKKDTTSLQFKMQKIKDLGPNLLEKVLIKLL